MQNCHDLARTKARYGHRDWIVWRGKDGGDHAELQSAASLKAAMLAVGTAGRFTAYGASTGISYRLTWRLALVRFRNARAGYAG